MQGFFDNLNQLGKERTPFFFMVDFEMEKPLFYALDQLPDHIKFQFPSDYEQGPSPTNMASLPKNKTLRLNSRPISRKIFKNGFEQVMAEIEYGNSFLLNLTYPSEIEMNYSLEEIFQASQAKYKVLLDDHFVSFSPETFVKIKGNSIYSYPMKGTIDAAVEHAEEVILANEKEQAEHYTIVDLIRNDLAQVSEKIEVTKFRYIDEIKTNDKTLLQVSSEIKGQLPVDWHETIGTMLKKLLPAGSISGAPKKKTLEIIKKAEIDKRGYYTGIAGVYDGESLDSCVLIRYIEQQEDKFLFRSGGGITFQSNEEEEYTELQQKIYVPIF